MLWTVSPPRYIVWLDCNAAVEEASEVVNLDFSADRSDGNFRAACKQRV
jgi:hypothetical protein